MFKIGYRIYQKIFKIAFPFIGMYEPIILDDYSLLKNIFNDKQINSILIVSDSNLVKLNLLNNLIKELDEINFFIYDNVSPNPTIDEVEEGVRFYKKHHCQAIIGFGGGSPIDVAKIIAARINNHKSVSKMRGQLKIRRKLPLLIAIPTTSGTGSEATLAAVIVDSKLKEKYAVNSPKLIPKYALLDPTLTLNLPKNITASTGMDALTHAVEAYIGKSNTKYTKEKAINAIKLIFKSLETSYSNPTLESRKDMQIAAYDAGCAFTRAYVGYCHAISHQLSALYNYEHGLTNAILLPFILDSYGDKINQDLANLSYLTNLTSRETDQKTAAQIFKNKIKDLNSNLNIPSFLDINEEDIETIIKHALKEANPLYPVPVIFNQNDIRNIINLVRRT